MDDFIPSTKELCADTMRNWSNTYWKRQKSLKIEMIPLQGAWKA